MTVRTKFQGPPRTAAFQGGKQAQEVPLSSVLNPSAISGVVRAALAERGVTVVKSVNSGDKPRIHYISAVGPQRSHSASLSRSQFIDR